MGQILFLATAALSNALLLLHTITALVKRRGLFCPVRGVVRGLTAAKKGERRSEREARAMQLSHARPSFHHPVARWCAQEEKFGPLGFMKLTHEAFRGFLPKLAAALKEVEGDASNPDSVRSFAALYATFALVFAAHSMHEDDIVFKTFDEVGGQDQGGKRDAGGRGGALSGDDLPPPPSPVSLCSLCSFYPSASLTHSLTHRPAVLPTPRGRVRGRPRG